MELEKVVQDEFNKIVENGTVQKIIADNLEKTIKSVIQDAVQSYSDFGSELKKVINEAVKIDMSRLNLLDYNNIVTTIIKEELDKSLFDNVRVPIIESIQEYIGTLEKKEYKLSEVIEMFIKHVKEDDEHSGEIHLEVNDSSYGYKHIYFDSNSDKSSHGCDYQLDIDRNGKIYSFKAGEYFPTTEKSDIRKSSRGHHGHGFNAFMFKLWANKCTIEVDEHACQTEWYND